VRVIQKGTVCLGWIRTEVCQVGVVQQKAVQPEIVRHGPDPFVATQMGNVRNKVGVDRTGVALVVVQVEGVRNWVVVCPRG
jgi:hypothetical protein